MNSFRVVGIFHVILFSSLHAQNIDQVRRMEAAGDLSGARTALLRAAEGGPANVAALTNYAEFLDRHSDPASLQAYARLLTVLRQQNDSANSALVARRLAA